MLFQNNRKILLLAIAICLNFIAFSQSNTSFDSLKLTERKKLVDAFEQVKYARVNDSISKTPILILTEDNAALEKIASFDESLITSLYSKVKELEQINKTNLNNNTLKEQVAKATHEKYSLIGGGILVVLILSIAFLFIFSISKKKKQINILLKEKETLTNEKENIKKQFSQIELEKLELLENTNNQKTQIQSITQKIELLQNEIKNNEIKNNEELSKLNFNSSRISNEYNDAIKRLTQTLREKSELEVILENKAKEILEHQNKKNLIDEATLTIVNRNKELEKELEILKLENDLHKQNIETETQVRTKIEGELQEFVVQLQAMLPLP